MEPEIKVDISDFQKKFSQYAELNKRDTADLANAKMLQLAFEAQRQTEKADPAKIQRVTEEPWWPKFVSKRIARSGKKPPMSKKGRKGNFRKFAQRVSKGIIGSRKRAAAFLKSGYLPAIRLFSMFAKDKFLARPDRGGGAKQYGKDKGSATAARPGEVVYAEITNTAEGIDKRGQAALDRAVRVVEQDMEQYIERKMQESIDKTFQQ